MNEIYRHSFSAHNPILWLSSSLSLEDNLPHNNDSTKKPQNLTVNTNPQLGDKMLIEKV